MGGKVKWKREACENEDQVTEPQREGDKCPQGQVKERDADRGKETKRKPRKELRKMKILSSLVFLSFFFLFFPPFTSHSYFQWWNREGEDWTPDFKTVPTLKAPSLTNGVPENSPSEDVLNSYVSNQVFFSSLEKAYVSNCSISESTFGDADFISLSAP